MKTTHFILGASAAGSLSEGFPDAEIVYWHDRYDAGPCRFDGAGDPTGWVTARSEWFAEWAGDSSSSPAKPGTLHEPGTCIIS